MSLTLITASYAENPGGKMHIALDTISGCWAPTLLKLNICLVVPGKTSASPLIYFGVSLKSLEII